MKNTFIRWIILIIAVMAAAQIIPGIEYKSWSSLLIAALVLAILNTFVRPILMILTAPLLLLTLGLFFFVLNALLLYCTGKLVEGFEVHSFWSALGGSLIISIVSGFLGFFGKSKVRVSGHRSPVQHPGNSAPLNPPPGKGDVIDI